MVGLGTRLHFHLYSGRDVSPDFQLGTEVNLLALLQILQDLDSVAAIVDYTFSRNTLLIYALCISKWSAMKI